MKTKAALLAFLLIGPLGAVADYVAYSPTRELKGDMRIVVETSAQPLLNLWVTGFKKHHPALNMIVSGTSPLAAAPTVASGAYDLGFPARELWPYEEEMFRAARGYAPTVVLVGLGAHKTAGLTPTLGVFVHASNPLTRISMEQLAAIFSRGRLQGTGKEIVTWGDLGATGEWAQRRIHPYVHRMPNGIDYFVQNAVTQGAPFAPSVIELPMRRGSQGPDEVIAHAIADDVAGIGFACLCSVTSEVKTLALARTASGPFYSGTLDEVTSMRYPLTRPIYMVVDRAPGKALAPAVEEFVRYALSDAGQKVFSASGGWLPLPAELAAAQLRKLD